MSADEAIRTGGMRGWCWPTTSRSGTITTKRHDAGPDSDESVMVDVDLSILGQSEKRFTEYEEQIRHEYEWVPAPIFASRRAEILERFRARKHIFHSEFFREQYEPTARHNLATSIAKLKSL